MITGREHRMTELFGRLSPGADLERARAELRTAHAAIVSEHPEAYSKQANFGVDAIRLRDQITSQARTVLLVLLAASLLIFVIAVSNVANLILARTVRREGELALRVALGASGAALRRTLLAESIVLCGAGAALGVSIAGPMVSVLARYASRFSIRALDVTLDASVLWVGVALAMAAAVLLAIVPRLPSADRPQGLALAAGGLRIAGATTGRLRAFAVTQTAASFVLLAGAATIGRTLLALQAIDPGFNTRQVLAVNIPVMSYGRTPEQIRGFYRDVQQRLVALPGVQGIAIGSSVPWRDAGNFGPGFAFTVEGRLRQNGEDDPRARFRSISPGFFASLGMPLIAGRDFTAQDRAGAERVVIVSESIARRFFSGHDAVNRHLTWSDPVMKFVDISTEPRRIVGVVPDVDDESIEPGHPLTVYHPFEQEPGGGRLFGDTAGDPYALVPTITRTVRELAADQPVERASTLEDVRAEVLAPTRLNAVVFGGFAMVALAISVVGVAGVLAFSVSGRIREFGIRLAVGSQPRALVAKVLSEGAALAAGGVLTGAMAGYGFAKLGTSFLAGLQLPGAGIVAAAAGVLVGAAIVASVVPAARAARVDVMQALRSE